MTSQEAVGFLASKRRTVLLGGMAVILHGLSRNTKDYDIWLDPFQMFKHGLRQFSSY